jgi:hypothetical protein
MHLILYIVHDATRVTSDPFNQAKNLSFDAALLFNFVSNLERPRMLYSDQVTLRNIDHKSPCGVVNGPG